MLHYLWFLFLQIFVMGCVCVICVNLLYFCKWETFITGLFHARLCTNHFMYIILLILTTLWDWCFFYPHLYTRKLMLRKIKWLAMFRKLVNLLRIWTSQMPKPISTGFFTFFFFLDNVLCLFYSSISHYMVFIYFGMQWFLYPSPSVGHLLVFPYLVSETTL